MYVLIAVAGIAAGLLIGVLLARYRSTSKSNELVAAANKQVDDARAQAAQITADAKASAETAKKSALIEAREEIIQLKQASEADDNKRKSELQKLENRVMQREESIDKRSDALDRREHQLSSLQSSIDKRKNEVDGLYEKQTAELERISALTREDAHNELLDRVRADTIKEEAQILRDSEQRVRAQADKTAREIVSTAIQRCAADQAGEITVTSVHIPSDDLKGRIIRVGHLGNHTIEDNIQLVDAMKEVLER